MAKGQKIQIEEFERWYEIHKSGKALVEISRELGVNYRTLYYGFKRLGFKVTSASNEVRCRVKVDHQFFHKIDSEEKAYILGFLIADGYITRRTDGTGRSDRVSIKLQICDKYMLEKFVEIITPGRKLYDASHVCTLGGKYCEAFSLEIPSNQIVNDLMSLGFGFNKTGKEVLPSISKELYPHLIRGLFDGDGSISLRKDRTNQRNVNICSASKSFLEDIQSIVGIYSKIYTEKRPTMDLYRLEFTTHDSRMKFYDYLYSNATIFLERKHSKYIEYVNTVLSRDSKESLPV